MGKQPISAYIYFNVNPRQKASFNIPPIPIHKKVEFKKSKNLRHPFYYTVGQKAHS
jgi:hypothetical protein